MRNIYTEDVVDEQKTEVDARTGCAHQYYSRRHERIGRGCKDCKHTLTVITFALSRLQQFSVFL